ncbi:DNA topoisomerase IV subunit A [Atopobacter phocae]|uniref:DNA topoisomerase IV subunit A n=1 Tax=Atopobacter phocae TaxID=136492 RepID=UPI00046F7DA3|nr:DNA topoisomerase IV subunit A [Atopobacter phocae]
MTERSLIEEINLDEVMGDRFGRYSKYIIQERALPDIRDGLKPVQRRILYAMYRDRNTYDHPFRKSAKTVGNVIGNYHPHGDSSVYEAMVRMSQDWKLRHELIEMHGNNGSMDGDPAAAMRYTEARLARLSNELLTDIEKETVPFIDNFDDTLMEPTVLPAGYPNLLVNGATGISAGYATDIPSHNLKEIIDATIQLIKKPETTLKQLLKIVKGPDFPTGGIIQGADQLETIYKKGKGRLIVRSQTTIETVRGGRQQIVVSEIPYEINKATLIRKIDEIRLNRNVEGILEVRDESDRNGLSIVIDLKKDANAEGILQYLLKKTDLQVNYNFNMIAIHNQHPVQVGLMDILNAYISFKASVIKKRTQFDLSKAEARLHIVDGLIQALSVLDEVIAIIRGSQDKQDAKSQLMERFDFTDAQAEAIVSLRLYRLSNTDIKTLQNERLDLNESIHFYHQILTEESALNQVIVRELEQVKKTFAQPRRTVIEQKIEEIVIDQEVLVPDEEVKVVITAGNYYKRTSMRSFQASEFNDLGVKEGDSPLFVQTMSTLDELVILTNKGNYLNIPVHYLPESRWKDLGMHFSQHYAFLPDERVIQVFKWSDIKDRMLTLVTKEGQIKHVLGEEFTTYRTNKSQTRLAMTLKTETDEVIAVREQSTDLENDAVLVTKQGFILRYPSQEISTVRLQASGVIAINLKASDEVIGMTMIQPNDPSELLIVVTHRGLVKVFKGIEVPVLSRAKRGVRVTRTLKSNPHEMIYFNTLNQAAELKVRSDDQPIWMVPSSELGVHGFDSNGSFIDEIKDQPNLDVVQNTFKA